MAVGTGTAILIGAGLQLGSSIYGANKQREAQQEALDLAEKQKRDRLQARQNQEARKKRVKERRETMAGRRAARKAGTVSEGSGYRSTIGMDGTIGG